MSFISTVKKNAHLMSPLPGAWVGGRSGAEKDAARLKASGCRDADLQDLVDHRVRGGARDASVAKQLFVVAAKLDAVSPEAAKKLVRLVAEEFSQEVMQAGYDRACSHYRNRQNLFAFSRLGSVIGVGGAIGLGVSAAMVSATGYGAAALAPFGIAGTSLMIKTYYANQRSAALNSFARPQ